MNSVSRSFSPIFARPNVSLASLLSSELHQWRGIRVKVKNNNLDQALGLMQRIMTSSGIDRMIKEDQTYHIKNTEKRVIARKKLKRRLKSQDIASKLKSILIKKVRGL